MADKRSPQAWRDQAGGPRKPDKKVDWKPQEQQGKTAGWGRILKLLGLAGLAMSVVAGIIILIWYLQVPNQPGLIVVAANPAQAADRLDVPYDPYGWLSAQRLLDWANASQKVDQKRAPKVLTSEPQWLDGVNADDTWNWIDQLAADPKADPVVVYVGLHGGVAADEHPVLYTGRVNRKGEAATIRVADLLDKLEANPAAREKRKVLILDVARGLPDPHLGEVHHNFVAALMKDSALQEKIRNAPRLSVICGAGPGQRAWESADLGMTSLAYQLMKGLSGEACPARFESFDAKNLVDYLQRETSTWAKNNRPTSQDIVVLPDPNADARLVEEYKNRKFILINNSPDLSTILKPGSAQLPDAVKTEWERCERLATAAPRPRQDSPQHWRRYRELLLRYEQAALAGDSDGQTKLALVLDQLANQIERHRTLPLTSTGWSLPMPRAAAQDAANDDLNEVLQRLAQATRTDSLAAAAREVAGRVANRPFRPIEAHLLLMTDFFYTKTGVSDGPTGDLWRSALRSRILAERATFSARDDLNPTYSERLWPLVRTTVLEADTTRRKAEDLMFAGAGVRPDPVPAVRRDFTTAEQKYAGVLKATQDLQDGMRLRDQINADAPYLGRWLVESVSTPRFSAASDYSSLEGLWNKSHTLAVLLDHATAGTAVPPEEDLKNIVKLASEIVPDYRKACDRFESLARGDDLGTTSQDRLQAILPLLQVPVPLFDPDGKAIFTTAQRARLIADVRRIEQELFQNTTPLADQQAKPSVENVRLRATLAQTQLNFKTWRDKIRDETPHLDVLNVLVKNVLDDPEQVTATAKLADALRAQWRMLADSAAQPPEAVPDHPACEALGRISMPYGELPSPEPGIVLRNQRWRLLLEAEAARIALDHWYAEDGKAKYFTQPVTAFLTDANTVFAAEPSADAQLANTLAQVPPLALAAEIVGGQAVGTGSDSMVRWTTEPSRNVNFNLSGQVQAISGSAVLWSASSDPTWLKLSRTDRSPLALPKSGSSGSTVATHECRVDAGEVIVKSLNPDPKRVRISTDGFFRGQRFRAEVPITVNSRPDLVVTDGRPADGAMLAIRADDDLEPGRISIIIDYSGSMKENTDGKNVGFRDPTSKMQLALKTLRSVLETLPPTTKVSIRVFSHIEPGGNANFEAWLRKRPYSEKIFPLADQAEKPEDFKRLLDTVFARLDRLIPEQSTPIVDSMREALADKDFLVDDGTAQTLLILTDGANTVLDGKQAPVVGGKYNIDDPAWINETYDEVVKVRQSIRGSLAVHMVLFSLGNEKRAAMQMFQPIVNIPAGAGRSQQPGKIWEVNDVIFLQRALDRVLRPKPRLLDPFDQPADGLPTTGLPVNRVKDRVGELWWFGPGYIKTNTTSPYRLEFSRNDVPIRFRAGDRTVVRMKKVGDRVSFQREVYYRDVDPQAVQGRSGSNRDWHVAVPGYNYVRSPSHFLSIMAALENNPGEGGNISHARPPLLWWDLARIGTDRKEVPAQGTVYVRNVRKNQAPAPTWRIIAEDGPQATMAGHSTRLQVWATSLPEPLTGRPLEIPQPVQLAATPRTIKLGLDVVAQVSLEDFTFYRDPGIDQFHDNPGQSRKCLVVRVSDRNGRILQARLPELENQLAIKEHRYFYARDVQPEPGQRPLIAGYTAVFGPFSGDDVFANTDRLQLELFSVSDVMANENTPPIVLNMQPAGVESPRPPIIEAGERSLYTD